jgi:uncharacterized membrane protein
LSQDLQQDYQRAATGYLVWPLALVDIVREAPDASQWERIHARQAAVFGIAGTLAYLVVLALPLAVVVAAPGITTTAVVAVYAAGMIADLVGALVLFGLVLYYSGRASRGELFAIPVVAKIVDRVFGLVH